jgi:hypothetical protein
MMELTIYDKARITGLDEKQIAKAQLPFDSSFPRTVEIHEAHDRVLIHAMWYDAGGKSVSLGHIGITATESGACLWRRSPPAVPQEVMRLWTLDEDAMKRSGKY